MTMRFSIAPINWSNDDDQNLGRDISLEQCLSEMREAGFNACELGHKFPTKVDALKEVLDKFGMTITSSWIGTKFCEEGSFDKSLKHFTEQVKFLAHFGVEALKVCECAHAIQQTPLAIFSSQLSFSSQQWQRLIDGLHQAGKIAKDHGMYIAYHHHLGTGVQNQPEIERLLHDSDPDLVSLLPDTGHLFAAGIDPLTIFKRFFPRIKYVHLKDVRLDKLKAAKQNKLSFMDAVRDGIFTVPSDGSIDFSPIFSLLKEEGFAGCLVIEAEQDPKKAHPLQLAKQARQYLHKHFNC